MDGKKVREAIEFLRRQIATLEAQKDWDEYGPVSYTHLHTKDMSGNMRKGV